jgi:hypothetical protein
VLHDAWPAIQNKTPLTEQDLVTAKALAERLIRAAGLKEQSPAMVAEVARIRHQAVTLMIQAYDQTRRAIAFLRWNEGDLETIAPSLYGGRVRTPKDKPAPQPNPAPAPSPAPEPAPAPEAEDAAAPGLPGAKPFLQA